MFLSVLLALGLCAATQAVEFAGGTGEPNDPYQIATAGQLIAMGSDPNLMDKDFVLMADIDLDPNVPGGQVFDQAVIGAIARPKAAVVDWLSFTGRFDGNGHIIRNLAIRTEIPRPVGLFADIGRRATVKRLGVEDADVRGPQEVGILAGETAGTIEACYTTGTVACVPVSVEWRKVAEERDKRSRLYDEGTLKQFEKVYGREMVDEFFRPPPQASSISERPRIGGLVGINHRFIESCYSAATVHATCADGNSAEAGGLAGANSGRVAASYSCGRITGNGHGLVGRNAVDVPLSEEDAEGSVFLSCWDIEASGVSDGGAGVGKTTAEMMHAQTFLAWDYGEHWTIAEGNDYPRLAWQERAATPLPGLGAFLKGSGQVQDPFVIQSPADLALIERFRSAWDKHFILARDIDMNRVDPNALFPIGNRYLPFTGHFDGRGHAIDNLTLHCDAEPLNAGLFGMVGRWRPGSPPDTAVVENLTLLNASVSGIGRVGALVGQNAATVRACHTRMCTVRGSHTVGGLIGFNCGHLAACSTTGRVHGERDSIGGLVGCDWEKTCITEDCRSECSVSGGEAIGGLVGRAYGRARNCCATGNVSGREEVGGLIGENGGTVRACYAMGDVVGEENVGGLTGSNGSSVIACYAMGRASGGICAGGLVGYNRGGIVASYSTGRATGDTCVGGLVGSQHWVISGNLVEEVPNKIGADLICYWDVNASGVATSDGGAGQSTQALMQAETFSGWDIDGLWVLSEGQDYPRLAWQHPPGKPIQSNPNRYAGGRGTANDPFRIRTVEQWRAMAGHPGDFNDHFVLADDLSFAGVDPNSYVPVGIQGFPFTGIFDGRNHTISNLTIVRPGQRNAGLFGYAGSANSGVAASGTRIMNLNVVNVQLEGGECVGGIVGFLNEGMISGCTVTGRIEGDGYTGGLAGWSRGEIISCAVDAEVFGRRHIGGLLGHNLGTVEACAAHGRVTGESRLGGLVGVNADYLGDEGAWNAPCGPDVGGRIARCFADCTVTGSKELGGLVGYTAECGRIESCYARGRVAGPNCVGGLAGSSTQTDFTHCYAAVVVEGQDKTGGFIGEDPDLRWRRQHDSYRIGVLQSCFWDAGLAGTRKGVGEDDAWDGLTAVTSTEMKTPEPFVNAGWDFQKTWTITRGPSYPQLRWEQAGYTP
jgi:hypothetical protein